MATFIKDPNTYARIIFSSEASYDKLIKHGNATEGDVILDKTDTDWTGGILHTHDTNFYFIDPVELEHNFDNLYNIFLPYDTPLEDGIGEKSVTVDKIKVSELGLPNLDGTDIDTVLSFEFIENTEKFLAKFWDDVTVWAEQFLLKPKMGNRREIDVYEEIMDMRHGIWGEIGNDDPENYINFKKDFAVRLNNGKIYKVKDVNWPEFTNGKDYIDFSWNNTNCRNILWTSEFGTTEYYATFTEILSLGDTTSVNNRIKLFGHFTNNPDIYANIHTSDGQPFICVAGEGDNCNFPKQGLKFDVDDRIYGFNVPPHTVIDIYDTSLAYNCNFNDKSKISWIYDYGNIKQLYKFNVHDKIKSGGIFFDHCKISNIQAIELNIDDDIDIIPNNSDAENTKFYIASDTEFDWLPTPYDHGDKDYWDRCWNPLLGKIKNNTGLLKYINWYREGEIFDATVFDLSGLANVQQLFQGINVYGLKISLPNVVQCYFNDHLEHLKYLEVTEFGPVENCSEFLCSTMYNYSPCPLETVIINMSNVVDATDMFKHGDINVAYIGGAQTPGFPYCTTVQLKGIKTSVDLSAFMNISQESVKYIMLNAQKPENIHKNILSLYKGVYDRLMNVDKLPDYVQTFIDKGWDIQPVYTEYLEYWYKRGAVEHSEFEQFESELLANDVVDISKAGTYSTRKAITQKAAALSIKKSIDEIIAGAPATYDTLRELFEYINHHEDVKTAIINFTGRSHAWYEADEDVGFTYPDDDLMNDEKYDDTNHQPYEGRTE